MKKILTTLFIFGGIFFSSAQSINEYKYIIIPESFEFLGEENKYQLNSLTKFLFEREGFNTLMRSEGKPADLKKNGCLGLNTELVNDSGLFVTKLVLKLKDCNGQVVFSSEEGRSREKEYQKAYHEALRDAFQSIVELDYEYIPSEASVAETEDESMADKTVVVASIGTRIEADNPQNPEEEEEKAVSSSEKAVDQLNYTHEGKSFSLNKTSQGYALFQEGSSEPIAILIESDGGKSFIYNSLTKQGIANFDADKNLIVEYFDQQKKEKVSLQYEFVD